ncbi:MAG: nucleotidyltransferase domain-containing protein [Acidimicrobiales bacterium]
MANAPVTFVRGQWNGRTIREWLPDVVGDIVRAVDPTRIIVFGSVARGDDHAESDLDLLVVLDHLEPTQRRAMMRTIRAAIEAPVPVDLLVTDVDEFDARRNANGSPYYWPSREGEVVHERPR